MVHMSKAMNVNRTYLFHPNVGGHDLVLKVLQKRE